MFSKGKKAQDLPPPPPPPIRFDDLSKELKGSPQNEFLQEEGKPLAPPTLPPRPVVQEPSLESAQIPLIDVDEDAVFVASDVGSKPLAQVLSQPELPAPRPEPVSLPNKVLAPKPVADSTITIKEAIEMKSPKPASGPIFVSAHDYAAIQDGVQTIRDTLGESESTINRLGELKSSQDKVFGDWKSQLADVEKKLAYIDQLIFSGE